MQAEELNLTYQPVLLFPMPQGPSRFTGLYVLGVDESVFQMAGISVQCLLKLYYRVVD